LAGTGTTAVVASKIQRKSIAIEIDPNNVKCIESRLKNLREADAIHKYYRDYTCTENLAQIWGNESEFEIQIKPKNLELFSATG
jgi:predicted RNA methylase